jgi:signal transduction histidine kinase/DNA-binding response OmpR family regulator
MSDADKADILVVDDLPEKLLVYQSVLEELGQNVITARSGQEALKHVLRQDFAVILLDVRMPGMDGFETAGLIRQRKKSAHTPIIFITSFIDEVRSVEGYEHGAVDYILAPVRPEVLRAKVRVFVDLFRMRRQVERQAEEQIALAEERARRAAAEEANRHSAFLAEAGKALASSLDLDATLVRLASLPVPFLADVSVVSLGDEPGRPGRTKWAWAAACGEVQAPGPGDAPPEPAAWLRAALAEVRTTGRPALPAQLDPPRRAAAGGPDFPVGSVVVLPLAARGTTLGALALAFGPSERRYGAAERSLAEDLASRAGIAVENALLVRNIQEADRRKDEFLAMLAHELRNPLAPIQNAVQVMRGLGPRDANGQWARDVVERQVRHLTRLVDDLLDVSRITRGKIRLQLAPLDVASVVTSAVETGRPLIEARRHEFHLSVPAEPLRVKADPARLSQVLSNLLNNAAKYTGEGGHIWLTVGQEAAKVVFRVRDTGPGIPPEMLPRIFDLFTQGDQSLDRSEGGLGIGLTLVRRLVEMHGGTVQALSAGPGQGSEFVVCLPVLSVTAPSPGATNGEAARPPVGAHRRVLVVDDNADSADTLAMLARLDGHEVRTAQTGAAALEVAQAFRPDVVLLDIGLPGMDGYEVARQLRAGAAGAPILLAAVTGYGQEADRNRSRQAGFDLHLVKPVEPEVLRRLLASPEARRASLAPGT